MRRLGSELGIEGMSLYHYVANKADLLDGITSRVFERVSIPDPELPWDDRLRALAWGTFEAFSAHPEVMRAISAQRANPRSPAALRVVDALLGALLDAGLDEQRAAHHYCELFEIIFSVIRLRLGSPGDTAAQPSDTAESWLGRHMSAEEFPHLHRALPALLTLDHPTTFNERFEKFLNQLRASQFSRAVAQRARRHS